MDLVIKTLGKSNLECASEVWKEFIEMNQDTNESCRDFVLRFENIEAQLQNAKLLIPSKALAMQMLMKSNLTSMSKENVLSKVDLDNQEELHNNVKKTLRELKSLSQTEKVEPNVLTKQEKHKPIVEEKEEPPRKIKSDEHHSRYSRRYVESSRRMEDEERRRDENRRRDRPDIRRPTSRGWNSGSTLPHGWKLRKPVKKTYDVSYTAPEDYLTKETNIEAFETEEEIIGNISKVVYQEGNIDVDPYTAVVDTGCPKTVCGKLFIDAFIASKGNNFYVRRTHEDQNFRFGDGHIYNSNMSHAIDVEIGKLKTTIETSVVDVNIPLLLGMDYLKKLGVVIDTGKEQLHIRKSRESFNIDSSKSNHWKLPIQNGRTLHKQANRLVLNVDLCEVNERELRKHIIKTHKNLAHKSEGHMTRLFQMAGRADKRTRRVKKKFVTPVPSADSSERQGQGRL